MTFLSCKPWMVHALVALLAVITSAVLFVGIEGVFDMMGRTRTLTDRMQA